MGLVRVPDNWLLLLEEAPNLQFRCPPEFLPLCNFRHSKSIFMVLQGLKYNKFAGAGVRVCGCGGGGGRCTGCGFACVCCANRYVCVLVCSCEQQTEFCQRFLDLTGPLQVGGLPSLPTKFQVNSQHFSGCIQDVYIDHKLLDLDE